MVTDSTGLPASGSPAATDQAELLSPDRRCEADADKSGFDLVAYTILSYGLVAGEHLGALAALYDAGEVYFSPGSLVRSVQENAARMMWVIGSDRSEPAQARLRRAYLELLLSAEQKKTAVGRLGSKSDAHFVQAQADLARTRRNAEAVFADVAGGNFKWTIDGVALASPQAGVEWMWELIEREANGSITDRQAKGTYDFLSSYVHPTLYPVTDTLWVQAHSPRPSSGGPRRTAAATLPVHSAMAVPVPLMEKLSSAAVFAFYNSTAFTFSYFGWPHADHDAMSDLIDDVLPGSLTD
jgi:hypothetical protein